MENKYIPNPFVRRSIDVNSQFLWRFSITAICEFAGLCVIEAWTFEVGISCVTTVVKLTASWRPAAHESVFACILLFVLRLFCCSHLHACVHIPILRTPPVVFNETCALLHLSPIYLLDKCMASHWRRCTDLTWSSDHLFCGHIKEFRSLFLFAGLGNTVQKAKANEYAYELHILSSQDSYGNTYIYKCYKYECYAPNLWTTWRFWSFYKFIHEAESQSDQSFW